MGKSRKRIELGKTELSKNHDMDFKEFVDVFNHWNNLKCVQEVQIDC